MSEKASSSVWQFLAFVQSNPRAVQIFVKQKQNIDTLALWLFARSLEILHKFLEVPIELGNYVAEIFIGGKYPGAKQISS